MEENLAKQIKDLLDKDDRITAEIHIGIFVKMWGNNINNIALKLIKFSKKNKFGHISVLRGNRVVTVRFWKIEPKEKTLLE